jgi:hypothetical protein
MAKPKIQMKISGNQYKALLERVTSRNQATSQSSMETMGMDPQMMNQGGGVPTPSPMMQEAGIPTPSPTPGAPGTPQIPEPQALQGQDVMSSSPSVGALASPQEAMQQVSQIWQQLRGGVGEQLWRRLAEFSDPKGAKNPEGYFIQEATKYVTNPASVTDERVRKFLGSILGESSPAQGGGDGAQVLQSLIQ